MKIREATLDDYDAVKKIDSFGEQLAEYSGIDALDTSAIEPTEEGTYFKSFVEGKEKWCFVAEDEGEICGFIYFMIKQRTDHFKIKQAGYIDLLFVSEKYRGRGIGKKLLNSAYAELKTHGIFHVDLSVHTDNPSTKFWESMGFKEYKINMWKPI